MIFFNTLYCIISHLVSIKLTMPMERWNNTLRQANARYVRKTLSFSKSDFYHELVTRLFIIRYNLRQTCET
jgi:IS1 family transposase